MPVQHILQDSRTFVRIIYGGLRRRLRRIELLRNGLHLFLALKDVVGNPLRTPAGYQHVFESQVDPFNALTDASQSGYPITLEMLDRARGAARFRQALEIGCAEGVFTEMLSPRCESLLAVDFVPIALERARQRCSWNEQIQFKELDLRHDELRGDNDLVLAMGVLSTFFRPRAVRAACAKIIDSVSPGGYLFLADVRQDKTFETQWWGKLLLRGGQRITAAVAQHPELTVIETAATDTHVMTLFRKAH